MKTTKVISMAEFAKEVEKIALKAGKTYYGVDIQMRHFIDKTREYKFSCYVDGYGLHDAKTPNECLTKLRERISPKKSIIEDVLV